MRRVFYACVVAVAMISTSASLFAQAPQSPGKEHEELKALEGVWDAAMTMADGSEVKAESEFKMTCEGMWLASDFRGVFGEVKFHGVDHVHAAEEVATERRAAMPPHGAGNSNVSDLIRKFKVFESRFLQEFV